MRVVDGLVAGRRSLVDIRGAAAGHVRRPAPARPEHEREEEADGADHHEDDADRVDVEPGRRDVDGPGHDRTGRDENQADSDTHSGGPPWGCSRRRGFDSSGEAGVERATVRIGYGRPRWVTVG